jgi:DNA-binding CsgD family transcriptional regulator
MNANENRRRKSKFRRVEEYLKAGELSLDRIAIAVDLDRKIVDNYAKLYTRLSQYGKVERMLAEGLSGEAIIEETGLNKDEVEGCRFDAKGDEAEALMKDGKSNGEIAEITGLGADTIERLRHRANSRDVEIQSLILQGKSHAEITEITGADVDAIDGLMYRLRFF